MYDVIRNGGIYFAVIPSLTSVRVDNCIMSAVQIFVKNASATADPENSRSAEGLKICCATRGISKSLPRVTSAESTLKALNKSCPVLFLPTSDDYSFLSFLDASSSSTRSLYSFGSYSSHMLHFWWFYLCLCHTDSIWVFS